MKSFIVENLHYELKNNCLTIYKNQKGKITFFIDSYLEDELIVIVEENVELEFIEINEKENLNINFEINNNSSVHYNVFSKESAYSATRKFSLGENAYLLGGYADFSHGKKNLDVEVNLNKIHAQVDWHLASLSQKDDKKIYNINFYHNEKETKARMDNYGVCKDTSTLEFLGDAIIKKGAKKSSTKQNAKIVVFDALCKAKASPKLCIYENDVEASHGASEGQINPDHVFYLMSRGIDEDNAKRLITLGYLNPICKYFSDETICNKIHDCIIKEI